MSRGETTKRDQALQMRRAAYTIDQGTRAFVDAVTVPRRWKGPISAQTLGDLRDAHRRLGMLIAALAPPEPSTVDGGESP